jgi:hypothetical protein
VHSGERAGRPFIGDALTTPIVQTSTYSFKNTQQASGCSDVRSQVVAMCQFRAVSSECFECWPGDGLATDQHLIGALLVLRRQERDAWTVCLWLAFGSCMSISSQFALWPVPPVLSQTGEF